MQINQGMSEAIDFVLIASPFAVGIVAFKVGLGKSIRLVGCFWWALAFGLDHFRAEYQRLSMEVKSL